MSNMNIPPPSYLAATSMPPYTALETAPCEKSPSHQTQYDGNNVYTVPLGPHQQQNYNQNYSQIVIPHAQVDLELQPDRNNRRRCLYMSLAVGFWFVIIMKFVVLAIFRNAYNK